MLNGKKTRPSHNQICREVSFVNCVRVLFHFASGSVQEEYTIHFLVVVEHFFRVVCKEYDKRNILGSYHAAKLDKTICDWILINSIIDHIFHVYQCTYRHLIYGVVSSFTVS